MWYTKYDNCPSFPSWDIVFKRFSNSTLVDPKWPLTSTKNNRLLYSLWYTYIPNMRSVKSSLLEISCLRGLSQFDPCWPPNDLWPPPKTIGFLYSMWYTCILHMRSVQYSLLEISCLQGFHNLTPVDPKWPLTSTKTNRLLVLNVVHLHTKYEICPMLPFLRYRVYKVFTMWSLLTPNDLWPPPKTIGFLYSMWYTYIPNMRYVKASLLEISCLRAGVTHTHTYTRTYTHTYTHIHTHIRHRDYIGSDFIETKNSQRSQ